MPAWLAPGLRREIGLPPGQLVGSLGDPTRHRAGVAVPHRAPEHGQREAVDLEVDDARDLGLLPASLAASDPLHDAKGIRVVVVRPEDHLENDADGGDDERGEQRPAEVVDRERVLQHVRGELQHEGVQRQYEQEAESEHEWQAQGREDRREDRVQYGDDGGDDDRAAGARDVDAGQDRGGHPERRGRDRPREEKAERLELRPLGLPGRGHRLAVGGRLGRHSASFAARFSAFFVFRCAFCSATLTLASV